MRILVVDDSRAMRMIVARALRSMAVFDDIAEAESAEAAIDQLRGDPVDLILCDWNMAGMTGLEFLEALRAAGWTVPFGFVTSESSHAILSSAMAAGASFLVVKPFTTEDLVAKVEAALGGPVTRMDLAAEADLDREATLRHLLQGLLRKAVTVARAPLGPERQAARWTADYVNTNGDMVAMCIVETQLASAMSAALTMMPPSVAAQWASSGALPDVLSENFHEVTNVIAKTVHADGVRCILKDVAGFAPGEQLPEIAQIKAAASAVSFEISVDGYGAGLISLVTL